MALNLVELDDLTRAEMQAEVAGDIATGNLYLSPRLSEIGRRDYPDLLRNAVARHDETWLAAQLRSIGRLNTRELSHSKTGKVIDKLVLVTAADTLAEGEFNRFYLRGLCRRANASDMAEIEVYRAKEVASPRSESTALIGQRLSAVTLLADLRVSVGVDTALGLPPGPNSGLSGRLIAQP